MSLVRLCLWLGGEGNIVRAQSGVMHGKTSPCEHTNVGVLKGITRCVPRSTARSPDFAAPVARLHKRLTTLSLHLAVSPRNSFETLPANLYQLYI